MDLNQVMNIWESSDAIPESDFKKIMIQIELNLKKKYALVPSYDEILSALIDLTEKNLQQRMASNIWMKSQGDSCKIISFQLRGYLDEEDGFIPSDSEFLGEVLNWILD